MCFVCYLYSPEIVLWSTDPWNGGMVCNVLVLCGMFANMSKSYFPSSRNFQCIGQREEELATNLKSSGALRPWINQYADTKAYVCFTIKHKFFAVILCLAAVGW